MKKLLIAMLMFAATGVAGAAQTGARGHAQGQAPAVAAVDSGGVVAYSDTTSADSSVAVGASAPAVGHSVSLSFKDVSDPFGLIAYLTTIGIGGVVVAIFFVILCLIVMLSPVALIVMILYFVFRRRKERYKIVEKAMETGRPLPKDMLNPDLESKELLWRKGVKNFFIGLGLVALFLSFGFDSLTGVGALVAIYGVGQAVIARTSVGKGGGGRSHGGDGEE